jgi:hypothetical protein
MYAAVATARERCPLVVARHAINELIVHGACLDIAVRQPLAELSAIIIAEADGGLSCFAERVAFIIAAIMVSAEPAEFVIGDLVFRDPHVDRRDPQKLDVQGRRREIFSLGRHIVPSKCRYYRNCNGFRPPKMIAD